MFSLVFFRWEWRVSWSAFWSVRSRYLLSVLRTAQLMLWMESKQSEKKRADHSARKTTSHDWLMNAVCRSAVVRALRYIAEKRFLIIFWVRKYRRRSFVIFGFLGCLEHIEWVTIKNRRSQEHLKCHCYNAPVPLRSAAHCCFHLN